MIASAATAAAPATKWRSPPQAAQLLGVEVGKIHHWIKTGELVAVNVATRVGGRVRWRISPDELDRFLASRQSHSPQKPLRKQTRMDQRIVKFY